MRFQPWMAAGAVEDDINVTSGFERQAEIEPLVLGQFGCAPGVALCRAEDGTGSVDFPKQRLEGWEFPALGKPRDLAGEALQIPVTQPGMGAGPGDFQLGVIGVEFLDDFDSHGVRGVALPQPKAVRDPFPVYSKKGKSKPGDREVLKRKVLSRSPVLRESYAPKG